MHWNNIKSNAENYFFIIFSKIIVYFLYNDEFLMKNEKKIWGEGELNLGFD